MTHSFEIKDAEKYGVSEAIILYNIRYWITINRANRENIHDGRVWTYNSARAFSELFPYFSADKIRRYLDNLEADGALIIGNYNKRAGDRTKWYSLPGDDGLAPVDAQPETENAVANPPHHLANLPEHSANPPHPFGKSAAPLPDINSDVNPIKNTDTQDPCAKPSGITELIRQYSKQVQKVDPIAIDYRLSHAVKIHGALTIEHCLEAILQASEDPAYPKDKLPGLSSLLANFERVEWWAKRYKKPEPQWWDTNTTESIIETLVSYIGWGTEIPGPIKHLEPQARAIYERRQARVTNEEFAGVA